MEILQFAFFQRAIIILVLVSIVAGIIGSLIVVKRLTMMGGSIAHGAFGGLGIAYYLGANPLYGAFLFSFLGAVLLGYIRKYYKDFLDSILTIFWAGGMSIGLIFVFLTQGYANDLFSYLFGNVLLNSTGDVWLLLLAAAIITLVYVLIKETLIMVLFNEDFARLKGVKADVVFTVFLMLSSLAVVILINTVGVVLTLAMLTISPSIALKLVKKISLVIYLSILFNIVTSLIGLLVAYVLNVSTAPIIILVQIFFFFVVMFAKLFRSSN